MALQQTPVAVPLFGSIDTKTAPKFVAPDKLLTANNVQFQSVSQVDKRFGQSALSLHTTDGEIIDEGRALGTFNRELLLYDGAKLYTEAQASDKFAPIGELQEVVVNKASIFRGTGDVQGVVSVRANTCEAYAYEYSTGGIYYLLRDPESGSLLKGHTLVDAVGASPRIVTIGSSVYIFYISEGTLKAGRISTIDPSGGIIQTYTVSTAINTGWPWAVCVSPTGDTMLLVYKILRSEFYWCSVAFDQYLIVQGTGQRACNYLSTAPSYAQLCYSLPGREAVLTLTSAAAGTITLVSVQTDGGFVDWDAKVQLTGIVALHRAVSCPAKYATTAFWQLYYDTGYGTQMPAVYSIPYASGA